MAVSLPSTHQLLLTDFVIQSPDQLFDLLCMATDALIISIKLHYTTSHKYNTAISAWCY